jgi:hypothetical protein
LIKPRASSESIIRGESKMDRYKITFTTSSGDSEEREIGCDSDAQAAEYAQANAHGRRALVYATEGRLVHDSQTVHEEEPR